MADKNIELYVTPHAKGWAITKPNAERVMAILATREAAVRRAKKLAGTGPVHVLTAKALLRAIRS
jgi:hypothetical protein